MGKQQLEQHYLDTMYSVFIDKNQYDIKIGKSIPADINKLINKEKSAVILTAWNPRSQALPLSENKYRNNELKSNLKNYTVFKADGQGEDLSWPAEESFFVLGIEKSEAEILAVKYEQYAYVWIENKKPASLVFTSIWQLLSNDS